MRPVHRNRREVGRQVGGLAVNWRLVLDEDLATVVSGHMATSVDLVVNNIAKRRFFGNSTNSLLIVIRTASL